MKTGGYPCEHGYYGICTQCVREERDEIRTRVAELERRAVHAEMGLAIDAVCGYFSRMRGPDFWYIPAEGEDDEDALVLPTRTGACPSSYATQRAFPLYAGSAPVPVVPQAAQADKGTCPACGTDIALTHAVNMLAAKAKGG